MPPALIEYGWLWLLCSFQGPPRGFPPGRRTLEALTRTSAGGAPVSQNSTACTRSCPAVGESRGVRTAQGEAGPRPGAPASRAPTGGARFGRRARPHGRRPLRRRHARERDAGHGAVPYGPPKGLPRKEVIQPHLPIRLPCYDLAPVTSFTLGGSLRLPTLGTPSFHGLTGGVCKVRERIHRGVLIHDY